MTSTTKTMEEWAAWINKPGLTDEARTARKMIAYPHLYGNPQKFGRLFPNTAKDIHGRPMVPCEGCTRPTTMTGTKLCDNCWEAMRFLRLPEEVQARLKAKHDRERG